MEMKDVTVRKAYWKRGFRSNLKADTVFHELERIKEKNGGKLTAGIVVAEAKKKSNPLHRERQWFWDDAEAAHEWRLPLSTKGKR